MLEFLAPLETSRLNPFGITFPCTVKYCHQAAAHYDLRDIAQKWIKVGGARISLLDAVKKNGSLFVLGQDFHVYRQQYEDGWYLYSEQLVLRFLRGNRTIHCSHPNLLYADGTAKIEFTTYKYSSRIINFAGDCLILEDGTIRTVIEWGGELYHPPLLEPGHQLIHSKPSCQYTVDGQGKLYRNRQLLSSTRSVVWYDDIMIATGEGQCWLMSEGRLYEYPYRVDSTGLHYAHL